VESTYKPGSVPLARQ